MGDAVIGLNPPYGVDNLLSRKFMRKAAELGPRMLVLLVPDLAQGPVPELLLGRYQEIYRDASLGSGRSFYIPGTSDNLRGVQTCTQPVLLIYLRIGPPGRHFSGRDRHGEVDGSSKSKRRGGGDGGPGNGSWDVNSPRLHDGAAGPPASGGMSGGYPVMSQVGGMTETFIQAASSLEPTGKLLCANSGSSARSQTLPIAHDRSSGDTCGRQHSLLSRQNTHCFALSSGICETSTRSDPSADISPSARSPMFLAVDMKARKQGIRCRRSARGYGDGRRGLVRSRGGAPLPNGFCKQDMISTAFGFPPSSACSVQASPSKPSGSDENLLPKTTFLAASDSNTTAPSFPEFVHRPVDCEADLRTSLPAVSSANALLHTSFFVCGRDCAAVVRAGEHNPQFSAAKIRPCPSPLQELVLSVRC
mmetsp:Transcript_56870/g.149800  ORF Transcript_56870/g.149800 Transcript_56870/m.149800 type:complete len:419 (+) Transcript_56870:1124-2380(+)